MPSRSLKRTDAPRTLHVSYVRMLLGVVRQSRPELLDRVDPAYLRHLDDDGDPLARCTLAEWHTLSDQLEQLMGVPDLAPRVALQFKPWQAGLLGMTLMTSSTVTELVGVLQRCHRLLHDVFVMELGADGDQFFMRLRPTSGEVSRRLARLSLSIWAQEWRWLTGRTDLKLDAAFEGAAPSDVMAYRHIFGGKVRFDCDSDMIKGPASYLELPIVSRDKASHSLLQSQAIKLLEQMSQGEDRLVGKVRGLIQARLSTGRFGLDDIAAELNLPGRTMQRRLEEAGAHFRLMVDEVRQAQAQHHLRNPDMSLSELAAALGFADHASFNRAFKRWTGYSPGAYRRAGLMLAS